MDRVCPLLGLAGDRRSVVDGVDGAHRCHAEDPPMALERQMQGQVCLTSAHDRCERFTGFIARSGAATPGRSSIGDGFVSTRMLLAPQPAWRGIAGRARGARTGPLIAVGAGVLAVGLGTAAVAGGILGGRGQQIVPSATPEPSPSQTVAPTSRPSPSPTAPSSPSPSSIPTPGPTPVAATPIPTAVPTPQSRSYVVQEGDTLAVIAQAFGTTTESIQQANGIDDPNEIIVGQVLVIP